MRARFCCFLLTTLFCSGPALPLADDEARVLGAPGVRLVAPASYEVSLVTRVLKAQTQPTVPEVTSYIKLTGPTEFKQISEDSLLESGYQVDLNGNGRIDEIRLEENDGLRLDLQPILPVISQGSSQPYREDGSPKRYRFGPDSPEFMVLSREAQTMSMALEHRAYRPEVVELPNPCLAVYLYEPCAGPAGPADLLSPPTFQTDFPESAPCRQNLSYRWQVPVGVAPGQQAQWSRCSAQYFAIQNRPGDQTHRLRVNRSSDSEDIAIFAQVIYSPEAGKQLLSPAVSGVIARNSAP